MAQYIICIISYSTVLVNSQELYVISSDLCAERGSEVEQQIPQMVEIRTLHLTIHILMELLSSNLNSMTTSIEQPHLLDS